MQCICILFSIAIIPHLFQTEILHFGLSYAMGLAVPDVMFLDFNLADSTHTPDPLSYCDFFQTEYVKN